MFKLYFFVVVVVLGYLNIKGTFHPVILQTLCVTFLL